MYLKSKMTWNVVLPAENLDINGLMLKKSIITRLMSEFAAKKVSKDHGYFLAVTTVESIGKGQVRQQSGDGDVLFPVEFSCLTFKMLVGEVLEGTVHKIDADKGNGVFLRCGPAKNVFLFWSLMQDYHFVPGENPYFMNAKSSKIEIGVVLRFVVIAQHFVEDKRDFIALASLNGDYLGPIS